MSVFFVGGLVVGRRRPGCESCFGVRDKISRWRRGRIAADTWQALIIDRRTGTPLKGCTTRCTCSRPRFLPVMIHHGIGVRGGGNKHRIFVKKRKVVFDGN